MLKLRPLYYLLAIEHADAAASTPTILLLLFIIYAVVVVVVGNILAEPAPVHCRFRLSQRRLVIVFSVPFQ